MIVINGLSSISIDGKTPVDVVTAIVDNPKHRKALLAELNGYEMHLRLSADNGALHAEIAALKTKLAPDIASITPALLEAGLLAWGQDAVSAVDSDKGAAIMGLVMDLKMVAIELPSITQCDRIKQLFGAIMHMSGVQPTSDQATAMQAVLDVGSNSTGPVAAEYLDFRPFI